MESVGSRYATDGRASGGSGHAALWGFGLGVTIKMPVFLYACTTWAMSSLEVLSFLGVLVLVVEVQPVALVVRHQLCVLSAWL